MPRVFPIATIGGIVVQARWSAAFAFLVFFWFLASLFLPDRFRGEHPVTLWSLAFLSTLAIYLSTIAHELGHALVARARRIPVRHITVTWFSGHADISQEEQNGTDEALISAAGPGVSVALAALALGARLFLPDPSPPLALFLEALLLLNAWLALYNLLPVPPLDGGRAVRGLLWRVQGDFLRATSTSVAIGRGLAALIAVGSLLLFLLSFEQFPSFLPPGLAAEGKTLSLVGLLVAWLLNNGARSVQRSTVLQQRLAGLTVANVMSTHPKKVSPWTSLEEIANDHLRGGRERAVAVVRGDDTLVGLVAYSDVARVPPKDRATKTAGEVMTAVSELLTVAPDDSLDAAVRQMAQHHLNQLPVVSEGRIVGMIDRARVLEIAEARDR